MATRLIVHQDNDGRFFCEEPDVPGAPICGYGASVLEAVGSWAVYSQTVEIVCQPPAVLNEFTITNRYTDLTFEKSAERD